MIYASVLVLQLSCRFASFQKEAKERDGEKRKRGRAWSHMGPPETLGESGGLHQLLGGLALDRRPCQLFLMFTSALKSESCSVMFDPFQPQSSPPGSSVHGILQARILEWVAFPSSRESSQIQGLSPGLLHCRCSNLYHLSHQGSSHITCIFPEVR